MIGANAERRIGRGHKIDMKQPSQYIHKRRGGAYTTSNSEEHFIPASRRRSASAKISRNQAIGEGGCQTGKRDGKGDGVGGTASEHRRAIQRESPDPVESGEIGKQVDREEIRAARLGVIPQRELWVIAQLRRICRVDLQRVEEVAPGRVRCLGNSDTLPEGAAWKRWKGEIAYQPAVSDVIIENKRVSVVLTRTRRARQGGEE